jgi:hypothetical protein
MTLDTVVADSHLDEKQIGTFIRGQGNPTYGTLLKLCKGLHTSPAKLIARAEQELVDPDGRHNGSESSAEAPTTQTHS